jgi:predicted O-methyltransferase YrrM
VAERRGTTINRFLEKMIKPIMIRYEPKHIVEIGAVEGRNTIKLLEYCKMQGIKLTVIDPKPLFNIPAFKAVFFDEQLSKK